MANQLFLWDVNAQATQNTAFKVVSVQFGDGFEQVKTDGVNNLTISWSCDMTDYDSVIDVAYAFLVEKKGVTPFDMNIDGRTQTFRTYGEVVKSHVGGKVWRLSFNIKQVHIPKAV